MGYGPKAEETTNLGHIYSQAACFDPRATPPLFEASPCPGPLQPSRGLTCLISPLHHKQPFITFKSNRSQIHRSFFLSWSPARSGDSFVIFFCIGSSANPIAYQVPQGHLYIQTNPAIPKNGLILITYVLLGAGIFTHIFSWFLGQILVNTPGASQSIQFLHDESCQPFGGRLAPAIISMTVYDITPVPETDVFIYFLVNQIPMSVGYILIPDMMLSLWEKKIRFDTIQ